MVDMAMHMMDISQNSIRAEAKNILISFYEDSINDLLVFSVKDDGLGMSAEEIKRLEDPFFTTRTTRKVGLGIPFLKMTCEQTGGFLSIQSKNGEGTTIKATYRTDNPDCLPTGDIAGYLAMLLLANPEIRIKFTYNIDGKKFVLDTDELKQQGIYLHQSGMSGLIKTYLKENLNEITSYRSAKSYLC